MATITGRRAGLGSLRRREALAGYAFVLPWLFGLLVFTAYPVAAAVYFSLTEYSIVQPPRFVGVANYKQIFTNDPAFLTSLGNSAYYAFISVPLGLISSLLLAVLLNLGVRGIGAYRTLYYLPSLAPPVAGTIIFIVLMDPSQGVINAVLGMLGLPGPGWFRDPAWSKPGLIVMSLWGVGIYTLIFLAGLKEIPQTLLEAAAIDGAGPLRRFRHVTLPLLSPVVLFNLVMGCIWSFQVFSSAFVIGGTTGQPLESLLMYMIHIYRNAFRYFQMGYASALSLILFLAIMLVTLAIFWSSGRWVFYQGEES